MKPTSARCRSSACARDSLQVRTPRADEVAERVAAELLAGRARELERDRGLGDDRERLDGGDVAALDERLGRLAGLEVDRAQRLHQRRQRLHRRAHDDLLAVRDAALDARRRGSSRGGGPVVVGEDLVVGLRAAQLGELEAVADLDALDRLDAHQRRRQPRVQPLLLGRVRAEPRRHAVRAHLDDPADGVTLGARVVDPLLERLGDDAARARRSRSRASSAFATAPAATARPSAARSPAPARRARRRART